MRPSKLMALLSLLSLAGCAGTIKPVSVVDEYCTRNITPEYRVEAEYNDTRSTKRIIKTLEKVPDPLQRMVSDYGATVVLFGGEVLDHIDSYEGTEDLRGVRGVLIPSTKEVFIHYTGHSAEDNSVSLELHEYGHAVDMALAELPGTPYTSPGFFVSRSKEFSEIHKSSMRNPWFSLFVMARYERTNREFFAESFARFYYSDRTRESMKQLTPECYEFFRKMEEYFLSSEQ